VSRQHIAAFISGLVFAIGLVISGMTNPAKVIGFLDFAGDWDPSLAFVMVGGILVHATLYPIVMRAKAPWVGEFQIPTRRDIDGRLVLGATMFGIGWGLSGFCPGPAIVSLASLGPSALVFGGTLYIGMALFVMYSRNPRPRR
jgi:uncharacterized membrane protein YedE/YeeE